MKKHLFTGISILIFGYANAQDTNTTEKNIEFGTKAGLNFSMVNTTKNGHHKMKTGFHIGGLLEFKLGKKMGLQPELMFSKEGGTYEFSENYEGSSYYSKQEITLNKVIVPIMFKFYVIEKLSLEVGPELDYIISAKSNSTLTVPGSAVLEYNVDMDQNSGVAYSRNEDGSSGSGVINHDYGLKKLNFGVNLGASYKLPMNFFLQARYNLGLTDFTDNGDFLAGYVEGGSGTPIDFSRKGNSMKNSNIQISVGYKF